ncbi:PREDICTED: uncharacterized protein LOC108371024 [Rhagoletis zephyria]|uniref:uncharacterized protein LOC108371024 n=1 Tax=Rhagoletis zephyria TaxID=28612 RepID=UPI0008119D1F|nr:PREDICTED: uncharacterized protein LOC108371024 [Rhagoletis zephyria]
MTCTKIRRELKCKFPPCPCQKCSKFRGDNGIGPNSTNSCSDIPPERPIPKYKFQCKCPFEPEIIGPKYERKCPPPPPIRTQFRRSTDPKGNCPEDDCNTGKGCCNTGRNFLTFMINLIGFVALVIIWAIAFWLCVFQWTVILSFKVYNSDRTTQVAVAAVIIILFLLILYSAALRAIRRAFSKPKVDKLPPARAPSPSPQKSPKIEKTSSMFSWSWSRTKESTKPHTSLLPSFRRDTVQKNDQMSSSWMSFFTWGRSKKIEAKPETHSSWMPSFRWTQSKQKELKKPEARSSWISLIKWHQKEIEPPTKQSSWVTSFRWTQSKQKQVQKPEARSSWISLIKWHQKEIEPPPKQSSWLTSFSWFHSTSKATDNLFKKPETRTIWSPWTFDWCHCASYKKDSSSSWMPSFMWGQSAPNKKTPSKRACNRSPDEMKKQKVTVTITDEEARQIFKQSKLYAIPTEMKQPPALIIYLRDLIQRNTD